MTSFLIVMQRVAYAHVRPLDIIEVPALSRAEISATLFIKLCKVQNTFRKL